MTFSTVQFDTDANGIAVLTFNRPAALNALNSAVLDELERVVHEVETGDAVGGLIFTGAGKAFVAGADIAELAGLDAQHGLAFSRRGSRLFRQIEELGKPVIAAVNGFALGGGCELAMACHVRLAAPAARFGQPEVKLGLIAGFGGTVRLPRLVGRGRALELLLTGSTIDADEAMRIGLINRVVPTDQLLDQARAMMQLILAAGPLAVRETLRAVDGGLDLPIDQALSNEAGYFGDLCGTTDKGEGTRAFLEKRPPVFQAK